MDAAEFLGLEADRVVASAAGTQVARHTYALMHAVRNKLLRGETLVLYQVCQVKPDSSPDLPALLVLTDRHVHVAYLPEEETPSPVWACLSRGGLVLDWRALTLADGSRLAVLPGVPDIRLSPSQSWELAAALSPATLEGDGGGGTGIRPGGEFTPADVSEPKESLGNRGKTQAMREGSRIPGDTRLTSASLLLLKAPAVNERSTGGNSDPITESSLASTSSERLKALGRHRDERVRRNVAANSSTPPQVLRALAADRQLIVREEVASNPHTPADVLERLRDDVGSVQTRLAANPSSPEAVLDALSASDQRALLRAIASNPAATQRQFTHCLEVLLRGGYLEKQDAYECLANPRVNRDFLEEASTRSDPQARASVAANPSTPPSILSHLARDDSNDVRAAVAANPSTSPQILEMLASDVWSPVLQGVSKNANTPLGVLVQLAGSDDFEVQVGVASNPFTPVVVLESLARDEEEFLRLCVAENPATPAPVLEILAQDEDEETAQAARGALAGRDATR